MNNETVKSETPIVDELLTLFKGSDDAKLRADVKADMLELRKLDIPVSDKAFAYADTLEANDYQGMKLSEVTDHILAYYS